MTELLTSAQMRAIETAAIESGEVTGLDLMERAGRGVVEAIGAEWPELQGPGHRALVLCGPGNNGGDGFVIARLLKERGWAVKVFLHGDPAKLPPDARANHARWCAMGKAAELPVPLTPEARDAMFGWIGQDRRAPLHVVDALFGIGLRRPVASGAADDLAMLLVDLDDLRLDEGGPPTRGIAIDVPSGLCADSGRILVPESAENPVAAEDLDEDPRFFAFRADLTVTFHRPKPGHFLGFGPRMCGKLRVVDIGLDPGGARPGPAFNGTVAHRGRAALVSPPRPAALGKHSGHKFSHGHALVLSGPPGHGGAARLAARGALRIGAGLVTLGCPPEALAENAARLDAVMLRQVADGATLAEVLADKRINTLCLGPGLGTGPRETGLVAAALGAVQDGRALVLDADALTLIAGDPALFGALHEACVLTPHGGEFARLFPDLAERLETPAAAGPAFSKVDATRAAAARAGCTVLFKGADTVIADPSGRCAINAAVYDRTAPWLATAGSGDVLAGFITGLVARGFSPYNAACAAAWLHAECARSFGPGLIAEDLPEELPKVFRAMGL